MKRSRPTITLRLVNEGGVDRETLLSALKETRRILRYSGIDLVWFACQSGWAEAGTANPCSRDLGPTEFWMGVVTRQPEDSSANTLGFTRIERGLTGKSAGVYYPAVVRLAKMQIESAGVGEILGAVIAHEVGHLILGANAHSSSGVMCDSWSQMEFRMIKLHLLSFTADQSRTLRDRVERYTSGTVASTR
jgi:hypothetical protein